MTASAVQGVTVPRFLYGTAWKEDATRGCVTTALEAGFRGIDTANQRKHYHEAEVGKALADALAAGLVRREGLFVQTKFTHRDGQDRRLPYDPKAPLATQVRQSFESSVEHLGVATIDGYLLHGPSARRGIPAGDLEVWRAMERLHDEGRVRLLGASNVTRDQVRTLCDSVRIAPAIVQNRCYASTGWDREVRALCRERGIVYQGFSLLTANAAEMRDPAFGRIVARVRRTPAQVVFRFALAVGMVCLVGSTSRRHLLEDLACTDFDLSPDEVDTIERIALG